MSFDTHTLLDRFLRYVRIDTQANEKSASYPSTPGQLVLGKMLRDELLAMGIKDAVQTEHGIVFGTVPGNVPGAPTIAFNAHVDTSPETTGKNVDPQVIRHYPGGDIVLPKDPAKVIRVAESPDNELVGKTIVTTDGTTLRVGRQVRSGGDHGGGASTDREPDLARARASCSPATRRSARAFFTRPKDIGAIVASRSTAPARRDRVGNLLGGLAVVAITGVNIHPRSRRRMTNAVRLAGVFLERLPKRVLSPETTADRDGFLHPYVIEGGVGEVKIRCLLRDFDTPKLADYADLLREAARQVEREHPEARVRVEVTQQYRNMRDGIAKEPRALQYAEKATRRAGLEPKFKIIRGGTDGAMLTAKGLPTPNLSTGEHNFHSPLEWTCLEEMEAAVRVVVELCQVWAGR